MILRLIPCHLVKNKFSHPARAVAFPLVCRVPYHQANPVGPSLSRIYFDQRNL